MDDIKEMLVKIMEDQASIISTLDKIDVRLDKLELGQESIMESVDVMKDIIGRHHMDIEILKRRPA